ncbi:hypothetical protein DERP_011032 [Dermatophagoides pteronyssinus]|uniref:Uncharacterized protein n=1 Tax=Dermatophagoides pteronyssinus TaxID=6956 RepID=A0ABQ8JV25_DERPT|nr:hypothetical protein DERP_011032 [Dermatophagoides pteronyssinus]
MAITMILKSSSYNDNDDDDINFLNRPNKFRHSKSQSINDDDHQRHLELIQFHFSGRIEILL